jgi:HEAT repeat protein
VASNTDDGPGNPEMIPATELTTLWSARAAEDRRRAMDALTQVARDAIADVESGGGSLDPLRLLRAYVELLVAAPIQLTRLLDDPVADVRAATATALEAVAGTIVHGLLRSPELHAVLARTRRALLRRTDDEAPAVRAAALRALGRIGAIDPAAAPRRAQADEPAPASAPAEQEALRNGLGDPRQAVRHAAGTALGRRLGTDAAADLAPLANDVNRDVQDVALEHLVAAGDRRAEPVLLRRLAAGPTWQDLYWTQMLGLPAARAPLLALITTSEDANLLQQATSALIETADASCVPALRRLLARGDAVAGHAALALGRLRAAEAGAELVACLTPRKKRDFPVLDELVAIALARIGDPAHAPALLATMRKRQAFGFLDALAVLGHTPALPQVRSALGGDVFVLRRAALALGHLGGPADRATLVQLTSHRDAGVRMRAALGLALLAPDAIDEPCAELLAATSEEIRIHTREDARLFEAASWLRLAARATSAGLATSRREQLASLGLAWVRAHQAALPAAILCYRGRGDSTGPGDGIVFILRDVLGEAEQALDALATAA